MADEKKPESGRPMAAMTIGLKEGRVIVQLGESVSWIGFTPEAALAFANSVASKAQEALDARDTGLVTPGGAKIIH
jgi:hypothetical protein